MNSRSLPALILRKLRDEEPGDEFNCTPPIVRSSLGRLYFVKIGSPREVEQYIAEEQSLRAMYAAAPGFVPRMIASGLLGYDGAEASVENGRPYFVCEYKDLGAGTLSESVGTVLGKRLAEMHRYESKNGKFGFKCPTYCGETRMRNGWYETWEECFTVKIEDLLQLLRDQGGYSDLVKKGDEVRDRVIPALLAKLDIKPVILHGDLWSGNAGTDSATGEPFIFDPSSFYGHNEFDLAIARMWGGFPKSFYEAYEEAMPRTEPIEEYVQRADLYELFHHLNHLVVFGGKGYAWSTGKKLDALLGWVESSTQ